MTPSAQHRKKEDKTASLLREMSGLMTICQDSYNNITDRTALAGGWTRILDSTQIAGNRDNGFFGAVYAQTLLGQTHYAVVFRGFSGRYDLDDVFNAVGGRLPKQVGDAYTFTKIAAETFGFNPKEATYAGHSLGGYLAKAVGLMANSNSIFSFNGIGLKSRDLKNLKTLTERFGDDGTHIDKEHLDQSTLSIYSKRDLVPKFGKLQGIRLPVDTPIHAGPHLLKSIELGLLKAFYRPPSESVVTKPKISGLRGFARNMAHA